MKKVGKHPEKALTAIGVKNFRDPGRYADGGGLYLCVDARGAKRWVARLTVQGKRRDMGLGGVSNVSLAEARQLCSEALKIAKRGGDPIAERKAGKRVVPTFNDAIQKVYDEHKSGWGNAKHGNQWLKTLQDYASPVVGRLRVDQIETSHLLDVLNPIWNTKPETAKRVKMRLKVVFDWTKAKGYRATENPVLNLKFGLNKQTNKKVHHRALPFQEISAFVATLNESTLNQISKLAFLFLIITASRTSEVLEAKWSEFDFAQNIWTRPASRMKSGREHRVPLGPKHLAILNRVKDLNPGVDLLFFDAIRAKPLPKDTFFEALRFLKADITTHGFRSTFRDWAAESPLNFSNEVCELALAHTIKNQTESAYRRGDLLDKRRDLMDRWADHAMSSIGLGNL